MRLFAIVVEIQKGAGAPTLRLDSAWDEAAVASDPNLLDRQIEAALTQKETVRAGVVNFDVDDLAVRACLLRRLPNAVSDGH